MIRIKSYVPRKKDIQERWVLVDATDISVGRLSSRIAAVLRGKNLPTYTPHVNPGTHVVVINAKQVRFSGNKFENKRLYRHTGYPGGLRSETYRESFEKSPSRFVENMVKGMLPKGSLGRELRKNLKVYAGKTHRHQAQNPSILGLKTL